MIFLPIVDRELRVAARRPATHWMRLIVAVGALLLGCFIYAGYLSLPQQKLGHQIFMGLSWLLLVYCLLAGRRSTADCLSEEKREGTLGLLFLTDLKGYDVVLGKLAATSVSSFYGLLAAFPILAVPIMMGGVTNGEFWRMVLVLVNTFLFSLAVGIFASSISRDGRKARGATLVFLLLITLLPPACAAITLLINPRFPLTHKLFYTCPVFTFYFSFDTLYQAQATHFWWSMAVIHAFTWVLGFMASRIVPLSWQDKPARGAKRSRRDYRHFLSYGPAATRSLFRRRLLDVNAFYWLASRVRMKAFYVWLFLAMMAFWWLTGWLVYDRFWLSDATLVAMALLLNSTFKLWITVEAGQRLAEDQKAGAMELLLSTPLSVLDILRGQFLALRRQFLLPMLAVIAIEIIFMSIALQGSREHIAICSLWIAGILMLLLDSLALGVVSMSSALTAKSASHAAAVTVVRVLGVPMVILCAIIAIANFWPTTGPAENVTWKFYLVWWLGLGIAADFFFGWAAWQRLRHGFRHLAIQRFANSTLRSASQKPGA